MAQVYVVVKCVATTVIPASSILVMNILIITKVSHTQMLCTLFCPAALYLATEAVAVPGAGDVQRAVRVQVGRVQLHHPVCLAPGNILQIHRLY